MLGGSGGRGGSGGAHLFRRLGNSLEPWKRNTRVALLTKHGGQALCWCIMMRFLSVFNQINIKVIQSNSIQSPLFLFDKVTIVKSMDLLPSKTGSEFSIFIQYNHDSAKAPTVRCKMTNTGQLQTIHTLRFCTKFPNHEKNNVLFSGHF